MVILQWRGHEPLKILRNPPWAGIAGGLCLSANYYWVTLGVDFSGPSNMAVLIQTASVFLVLVGVFAFREYLVLRQVMGVVIVTGGCSYFFMISRVVFRNRENFIMPTL